MRAFDNLLCNHLAGRNPVPAYARLGLEDSPLFPPTDFSEVRGQEHVKHASKQLSLEVTTYFRIGQKAGYFLIPHTLTLTKGQEA